jgi:oxygen-independent coproporphyrinogen-3 oxidase|tara:strand:+ start:3481 stop:4539 length:1059 start_codon:yes stop_codon:yes gene_type:complete
MVNRYVDALICEMEMVAHDLEPATIFFGGGTPSILNLHQWGTLLEAINRLGLNSADEWTVECNPATLSLEKAKLLRDSGVNRISMGVQSLNVNLLERLGRVHTREMVFKSYDNLRAVGFERINIDLMFAIPTQTIAIWRETLQEAIALAPDHLSCYEVIYEQDTPLYELLQANEFDVREDLACDMFDELIQLSGESGFHQYEVANFALNCAKGEFEIPSEACRHNINYWRGGDYHGLGPSATSYVGGARTTNIANTQVFCESLEKGERAIDYSEELEPLKRAGETAAFGLRMNAGWPFAEFQRTTGFDLWDEWGGEMQQLMDQGNAIVESNCFRLTPQGLRFADAAASIFLR